MLRNTPAKEQVVFQYDKIHMASPRQVYQSMPVASPAFVHSDAFAAIARRTRSRRERWFTE